MTPEQRKHFEYVRDEMHGEPPVPTAQPEQEPDGYVQKVIDALYENSDPVSVEAAELLEHMAQPEQEPVGEVINEKGDVDWISFVPSVGSSLYTTPPQRTWVGLTYEERMNIINRLTGQDWVYAVDAIEAKLKEKNT